MTYEYAQRHYDHQEPVEAQDNPQVILRSAGAASSLYLSFCGEKFLLALHNDMGSSSVFISENDLRDISDRIHEVLS
jgi:hypothetical protein